MNPVDLKYCGILSTRLERHAVKQQVPYRSNFRCQVCGDSKKSKTKTRGWLLEHGDTAWYYCFNCLASMSLRQFLKQHFPPLHDEYVADRIDDLRPGRRREERAAPRLKGPPPVDTSALKRISRVSDLPPGHNVRRWLRSRLVPRNRFHRLYFAERFSAWSNSILPGKLPEGRDEARLVMPFLDKRGRMFGYAGRSFLPDAGIRYLTMMIDPDMPKIYGMDVVDFERPYYVAEGQIDSLFVDNCCAMAGSSVSPRALDRPENATFVLDNEPRNHEIVKRMAMILKSGMKVVVWPSSIPAGKDINDLVLGGMSRDEIASVLAGNSFSGLAGELAIAKWRRS